MKIIKEGTVIFKNKKIVEIIDFHVDCEEKSGPDFEDYIKERYIYKEIPVKNNDDPDEPLDGCPLSH